MQGERLFAWFAAARAAHFASCMLIVGALVFDRLIVGSAAAVRGAWKPIARRLIGWTMPIVLVSGIGWFLAVAIEMSGMAPPGIDVLRKVLTQTHFGVLWQARLILFVATAVLLIGRLNWLALIFSALLLAALAWSGHGQTGTGPAVHLSADVVHLLAGGIWPAGLLPLAWMLLKLRGSNAPERPVWIASITRRFSNLSLAAALLLGLSGIANTYFLLGGWSDLFRTRYGRVLTVKIVLYLVMLGIGAANLTILRPRVLAHHGPSASRLRFNVLTETILALVVIAIVGILGLLPPPRM